MGEFIQFILWDDCFNGCPFCQFKDKQFTTSHQRVCSISQCKEILEEQWKTGKFDRIGLMGLEYFQGQLLGIETYWMDLIKLFIEKRPNKIFITAGLHSDQYMLNETLDLIVESGIPIGICTSYDSVGRFKSEEHFNRWLNNINELHENYPSVDITCTCIPTEDFLLDERFDTLPKFMQFNLCEPHGLCMDYLYMDKSRYRELLNKSIEGLELNLPKRRTFLRWASNPAHIGVLNNYLMHDNTHSSYMYRFMDEQLIPIISERVSGNSEFSNNCGHPYYALCYADSDKCMMCDARATLDSI